MAPGSSDKRIIVDGETVTPQVVEFESSTPYLLKDVAEGNGAARPLTTRAQLFLPEGGCVGRPAVLVSHGLGGQKPERELTYGYKMAKAGYVALVLDSFAARELSDADDKLKALRISTWTLLADIFAGLRFLATLPAVNAKAISVMGFSWGGMTTVLSAYEQIRTAFLGDSDLRFAGHAAYYGCSVPRLEDPTTTGVPVLMMIAARDRNVSAERSREIRDDLRRGGSDAELRIFDAFHQWDGNDVEKRHVFGALAALRFTITRDNGVRDEDSGIEVRGLLSRTLLIMKNLGWSGYDILRDEELHRQTDALLFEFLGRIAARQGAVGPETAKVPLGTIGHPAPPPADRDR